MSTDSVTVLCCIQNEVSKVFQTNCMITKTREDATYIASVTSPREDNFLTQMNWKIYSFGKHNFFYVNWTRIMQHGT